MGTRERRQREFLEREQRFLAAARAELCANGLLSLQMAPIARACDYSTGTLYQHFASKEDLLVAICTDLVSNRVELFQKIAAWKAPSRDRMFGIAVADVIFARHYPEHFSLAQYIFTEVVWRSTSSERREQCLLAHKPLGLAVQDILEDAIAAGDVDARGKAPLELALGQWSMAVGMHNLVHAEGVLQLYDLHDPYRLMLRNVQLQLNALNWAPVFDPFDDAELDKRIDKICREVFPELCPSGSCSQQSPRNVK